MSGGSTASESYVGIEIVKAPVVNFVELHRVFVVSIKSSNYSISKGHGGNTF